MDSAAFGTFYADSYPTVVGQIYAMCGDLAEAQDCTQEAFIRAWGKRDQLTTDKSPEGWVRTVAWRLAVSRWRRARRALLPPDRAHLPPPPREPNADQVALVSALKQIPAEQRRAIVLHYISDLSVKEIAAETDAPVGTVKARLARGRGALTTLLDDREPTEAAVNNDAEEARHA